jgi:hypothetical protein
MKSAIEIAREGLASVDSLKSWLDFHKGQYDDNTLTKVKAQDYAAFCRKLIELTEHATMLSDAADAIDKIDEAIEYCKENNDRVPCRDILDILAT